MSLRDDVMALRAKRQLAAETKRKKEEAAVAKKLAARKAKLEPLQMLLFELSKIEGFKVTPFDPMEGRDVVAQITQAGDKSMFVHFARGGFYALSKDNPLLSTGNAVSYRQSFKAFRTDLIDWIERQL